MRVGIRLPQWGMGISEGTVVAWLREIGDSVTEGEPLAEVETAKASDFVNSPVSGVLAEIVVQAGQLAPVGELLAFVDVEAGA